MPRLPGAARKQQANNGLVARASRPIERHLAATINDIDLRAVALVFAVEQRSDDELVAVVARTRQRRETALARKIKRRAELHKLQHARQVVLNSGADQLR